MKRKIEINIETRRTLISRPASAQTLSFCEKCNSSVLMLAADHAALLARVSPRTIYRWIEADEIHFAETADGLILICLDSLKRTDAAAKRQGFDIADG